MLTYRFQWSSKFIYFIILIIWCTTLTVNSYCDSDFEDYSPNNLMHKRLNNERQKEVIQNQILTLFGLKNRPNNITGEQYKRRSNANYLNAIYNRYSVLKDVNMFSSEGINLSNLEAIEESDVIISFDSQYSSNLSNRTTQFFMFNISKAFVYQDVVRSELVFYHNQLNSTNDVRFMIEVNVNSRLHNVTLNYATTESDQNEDNSWVRMDFTDIFKEMIYDSEKDFQIEINLFGIEPKTQLKESWPANYLVNETRKPTLVSYFKSSVNFRELNRVKRDLSLSSNTQTDSKITNHRRLSRKTCQLNSFFISFQELGWQDWIIAPEGYSSFFCSGQCSFPLKESSNATNHAIIQSLMQLLNPQSYPKPCCAAIKLASIELLYLDDDKNVTWKKYKNMVPRSCGCI